MMRTNSKRLLFLGGVICLVAMAAAQPAIAGVSAEEAAKLKTVLTPMGGERAGNKEGTIPAWEGGITVADFPSDYKPPFYDFFPHEKPLFSINAKNMAQYADKLSEANKALMGKYPSSYRIDVYPTHRTKSYPQWVYDNIFKNATRAKSTNDGETFEGAYGGIPFPIPKTGKELMWNRRANFAGTETESRSQGYLITADGRRILVADMLVNLVGPYYDKEGSVETYDGICVISRLLILGPPNVAGTTALGWEVTNNPAYAQRSWRYLPGQRRVRREPSTEYDTPNFIMSGVTYFDELQLFRGRMDLYEWKILGKKEMYIPYNNARLYRTKADDKLLKRHANPDCVRWELHRVWVLEAKLLPGKRHVVPRRLFYFDEDLCTIVMTDGWDAQGKLWRGGFGHPFVFPQPVPNPIITLLFYDLRSGAWIVTDCLTEDYKVGLHHPKTYFTPSGLVGSSVR